MDIRSVNYKFSVIFFPDFSILCSTVLIKKFESWNLKKKKFNLVFIREFVVKLETKCASAALNFSEFVVIVQKYNYN